jgi:hypothetical protein
MFVNVLKFNARFSVNCLPMSLFLKMEKKNLVLLEPNNFISKILIFNCTFWQNFACDEKITIFLLGFFLKWKFQNLCHSKERPTLCKPTKMKWCRFMYIKIKGNMCFLYRPRASNSKDCSHGERVKTCEHDSFT